MPGTAVALLQTDGRDGNVDRTTIEHDRGDTSTRSDRDGRRLGAEDDELTGAAKKSFDAVPHDIPNGASAPVAIGGGDEPVLLFGTSGGHRYDGT